MHHQRLGQVSLWFIGHRVSDIFSIYITVWDIHNQTITSNDVERPGRPQQILMKDLLEDVSQKSGEPVDCRRRGDI